jgi:hypothetical protein
MDDDKMKPLRSQSENYHKDHFVYHKLIDDALFCDIHPLIKKVVYVRKLEMISSQLRQVNTYIWKA